MSDSDAKDAGGSPDPGESNRIGQILAKLFRSNQCSASPMSNAAPTSLAPPPAHDMSEILPADNEHSAARSDAAVESTNQLKKCLAFLVDKLIPSAEQSVEQAQHAIKGVSTRSLRHRVFYDRLVRAQNWLKWSEEARGTVERGIEHGSEMTEVETRGLDRVERVVLREIYAEEAGIVYV